MLLLSGCASNTIVLKPSVKEVSVPAANTVCYRLNDVKGPYGMLGNRDRKSSSGRFTRLAEERYPALFKNSPNAIPLNVQIRIDQKTHDGAALATFMCTLGIFGGLLPSLPWTNELNIKADMNDGQTLRSTDLQAVHRGWWSLFSPCGLITISGESDIPAISTVGTGGPGSVPPEYCDYVMRRLVDRMAAELLSQKPGQFSAPLQTPAFAPSPGNPSGTLPLPTQTVAPF